MRGVGHLQNVMRLQAMLQQSGRAQTSYGIVSSYDPDRYCAKVKLKSAGKESGWLPIGTPWAGNGWGVFAPPPIGALVKIEFPEGVVDVGIVTACFFNDEDLPLACPAGEMWIVHQSGSYLKLTNDGKVLLHSTSEVDAGQIGQTLHQLVHDAFKDLFNGHTHQVKNVQGGSATLTSEKPGQQLNDSHMTAILRGN